METAEITKASIFDEVNKITAYTGLKQGSFDTLATTGDDERIMKTFWNEAVSQLLETVGRYGNVMVDGDDTLSLLIEVPANWRQDNQTDFCCLTRQYLINALCASWFNLSLPEKSPVYLTANLQVARSIKTCLAGRQKPQRG